jgi:CubicO group peptidase (beta-lactamase class C family)
VNVGLRKRIVRVSLAVAVSVLPSLEAQTVQAPEAKDLVGLWRAKRHFGPEVRGSLTIQRDGAGFRAEIQGRAATVKLDQDRLSFELAGGEGSFRGRLTKNRIVGHWIQPPGVTLGAQYASPVTLEVLTPGRWRGVVEPIDDEFTFYLPIKLNEDGTLGAFLRNPERNVGRFTNVEHVAFDGRAVKLLGRRSKDAPETTLSEGTYDADSGAISVPLRGGTYDFSRVSDGAGFYPRGKASTPYVYRPPPAEDDGWPVGTLEEVGLSREVVSRFIQMLIDMPIDSVHASDIHGVLIARHGKLVLEEYFHGFHRDEPHDTRSASKSVTSVLTGAALLHGDPISPSTPVYEAMYGAAAAAATDLDPRKRAITVENLLTMSSGLDCDDSNPDSPGNEDTMQEQTGQPDWYRYTLDQKMVRAPGEKAVYGSANPNLLGGVLARKTGRWLPDLFRDLVAEPLQIRRYAINLTPTGDSYMGGGGRFLPRDFMKLGQMMIDGGRWHGRQIVSRDWARKSSTPLYELAGIRYGYLWWVIDYPYGSRTVRAFFAGGNGGQVVMGIPELDLVVAFYGGNYSDPVLFKPQRVFVPQYILQAVK